MKKILVSLAVLALLLTPFKTLAKTLKIAVIDTGIESYVPHLCNDGHTSFVDDEPLRDTHGHGTHIGGLIGKNAGDGDYCIISIKYYDPKATGSVNLQRMIDSINYAVNLNVDIINISAGGGTSSLAEKQAITRAIDQKIKVVVAAGNEGHDLSVKCDYFPACYDARLTIVGNLTRLGPPLYRAPSSNYGKPVNRWEVGTNVESTCIGNKTCRMTGTSQATAVASGKIAKEMLHIK